MTFPSLKNSLILPAFLLAFLLAIPNGFADESSMEAGYASHALTLSKQGLSLTSPVLTESRPFNAISVQLDEVTEGLMVNFHPLEGGVWEPVSIHDDGFGPEALLFSSPTRTVQFRKSSLFDTTPLSLKLKIFYFDEMQSRQDAVSVSEVIAGDLVAESFRVIPRTEWGADETMRYWNPDWDEDSSDSSSNGTFIDPCEELEEKYSSEAGITHVTTKSPNGDLLTWPLQYMKSVRKLVVHHTDSELGDLNGDSRMDTRDYKEIIRAIYKYHTVSRGWGDIGYNYVIDPLGNIYEGRYGGDKVIGAHALCHNNGSIGIAIIGNYETNDLPDPAVRSLISLLANKAKKFGIDADGHSSFRGQTLPNILGHRDVRATSCPGKALYGSLPLIRQRVALAVRSGVFSEGALQIENLDYNAELVGGLPRITLNPNERKTLTLLFKNTGTKAWDNNTWLHVALNNNPNARVVPIIEDKAFVAADLKNHSVQPGGTGTFEVQIEGGYAPGEYSFEISPVVNGRYKVSRSSEYLAFNVKGVDFSYEVVQKDLPSGTVFQGQKILASIDLKNTGNVVWKNYGDQQITLGTAGPRDRHSIFVKKNPSRIGYLLDSEVPPGKTGRFVMDLEVPLGKNGNVVEQFIPVIEGVGWLADTALGFKVTVKEPIHLARMTKLNSITPMMPGELKRVELEMENRGDLEWDTDNMQVTLLGRGVKVFKANLTPTEPVPPKGKTQFSFWVQAPYVSESSSVFLRSRFNKIPIRGGTTRYVIQVPQAVLKAEAINKDGRYTALRPGEETEVTLQFKNTGNAIWYNNGPNMIALGTASPADRLSGMYYEEEWLNKFRPATMEEKEVRPGEIGTFTFKARTFESGIYNESFQLVIEGVGWVDGSQVSRVFRVFGEPVKTAPKPKSSSAESDATQNKARAAVITKASSQAQENAKKVTTPSSTRITPPTVVPTTTVPTVKMKDRPFRVKISHEADSSTLTADGAFSVENEQGTALFSLSKGDQIQVRKVGQNIHVQYGSVVKSATVVRVVPKNDAIVEVVSMERRPTWNTQLNDNRFRGVVEIRLVNDKMTTINELPLEDYLKGLGEVSNGDPVEKQKVIAVLARTYARFYMSEDIRKFPGMPYDGSDDPAEFQKYLGYGLEVRSPNFVGAVAATRDQVVIYQGKMVKTPYFNQSDGRTRSAEEVWGWKDTPYLLSVSDAWCKGLSLQGHGVGLSGCGATAQAKEGKKYEDIIKYYYTDVTVGKLDFE